MTIAQHWTDTQAYYALRRRLPKDPEPEPAPKPAKPKRRSYAPRRRLLLAWAADHDGFVNVIEAAAAMGVVMGTLYATLKAMGAEKVGARMYHLEPAPPPTPPPPAPIPDGRAMPAIRQWLAGREGTFSAAELRAALDVDGKYNVSACLRRLGAVQVRRGVYRKAEGKRYE